MPKEKRQKRGGLAPWLKEGTEAHYRDAYYYDHAYKRRREDVNFYADLAEHMEGPVLELGVGTGRVACAVARRGVSIVGVDSMAPMVARAKERVGRLPRRYRPLVELREGDLKTLRLRRRFPLVMAPFNVFMHLYTRRDVERGLETVRHHLARGGRFAFDVVMPAPEDLALDPERVYRGRAFRHPVTGEMHDYAERFRYDPATQIQTITMYFTPRGRTGGTFETTLTHRHFFPAEIETLLHYAGFEVEAHYGGFDGEALDEYAASQVIFARLRGR